MLEINELLKIMVLKGASDLHLKAGSHPVMRIGGELVRLESTPSGEPIDKLSMADTLNFATKIAGETSMRKFFDERPELDIAHSIPGVGRFRVNIFSQRGSVALAIRTIPYNIPSFEELNLPLVIKEFGDRERGLVLITGPAGSGKSTTLAAIIDHINSTRACNIITIEDPIEFLHKDKKSIISQRELRIDTKSFSDALQHIVRQDPDVIVIGEIRDQETMMTALYAVETGHLVFGTLHTIDAAQTIERTINFFPFSQHYQIRMQLASVLEGVVSLRLLSRKDTEGRVPAVEVLINTPTIKKLIEEARISEIPQAIARGSYYKMQTFNQSLAELYHKGWISLEEALSASSSPEELKLAVRGIYAGGLIIEES